VTKFRYLFGDKCGKSKKIIAGGRMGKLWLSFMSEYVVVPPVTGKMKVSYYKGVHLWVVCVGMELSVCEDILLTS
jgi:hypothetical protein